MTDIVSILNPLGYHASTCGYCSPPGERSRSKSSFSTGLQPIQLSCQTYQDMIDRGWRRSGTYCYKPDLRRSCCPAYTIKLDALTFKPSKSQRKLVTRWNQYVTHGSSDQKEPETGGDKSNRPGVYRQRPGSMNQNEPISFNASLYAAEFDSLIEDEHTSHRFEVTLEPASFTPEKFELYCKYQRDIHHEEEKQPESFRRFLVETPLIRSKIPYTTERPKHAPAEYGSYHQMYRIDGQLMAMGVLDILPSCVSSVYFMYDQCWGKFSLGKLSALREATLAKEIYGAGATQMRYLYMGFYIHSCQKMRYKGEYSPSFLADPETYEWYPLEQCTVLLEDHRYASFANPEHSLKPKDPIPRQPAVKLSDAQVKDLVMLRIDERRGGAPGVMPLGRSKSWKDPDLKSDLSNGIAALGLELSKSVVFTTMYS